eukprot:GDKJ01014123.1.p1 GENE.GDKJ01014123.1~~GDKJ01014123.1.p1  ORF type:complete len:215 (+),score=29.90 GDKJ01014123.1:35-679(+)
MLANVLLFVINRRPKMPFSRLMFGFFASAAERLTICEDVIARLLTYIRDPSLIFSGFKIFMCWLLCNESIELAPRDRFIHQLHQYNKVSKQTRLAIQYDNRDVYYSPAPIKADCAPSPVHPSFLPNYSPREASCSSPMAAPQLSPSNNMFAANNNNFNNSSSLSNSLSFELPPLPTAPVTNNLKNASLDAIDISSMLSQFQALGDSIAAKKKVS